MARTRGSRARPIRLTVGTRRITASTTGATATSNVRTSMVEIERNLAKIIAAVEEATVDSVIAGLEPIFDRSQTYVPVDTGELKESGFIDAQQTPQGVKGVVSYAIAAKPLYAVFVHERLDVNHATPTRAKFLEQAAKDRLAEVMPAIVKHLKGLF